MWVLIREKWTKWQYHGDRLRRPCGRSYHQVQRIYLQYEPSAFPMGIACRRLCVLIRCYPFRRFPSESLPSRNSKHASEIRILDHPPIPPNGPCRTLGHFNLQFFPPIILSLAALAYHETVFSLFTNKPAWCLLK